jgi:GR25 family glycosyltransferase involved in LPS biosynthesis
VKYTIISINDARASYKEQIRKRVKLDEVSIPATDGRAVDLAEELDIRDLRYRKDAGLSKGELGVWISTFDCWQWAVDNKEELVTFEDDAIPNQNFNDTFRLFRSELPKDYDFLSLWVPKNQYMDFQYNVTYDDEGNPTQVGPNRHSALSIYNCGLIRLGKVYQGYGNVAMCYSPEGAEKLLDHAQTHGINGPIDCWIYQRAHSGIVTGYAPKPHWAAKAVGYDWAAETTVHNTELHE